MYVFITTGMIAVVTGGGAGMGRQLCVQLCKLGAKVATCDVNEDKLAETVSECVAATPSASVLTFKCDVSSEEQCIAFKDATLSHFNVNHINLLFNNAGIDSLHLSYAKSTRLQNRYLWRRFICSRPTQGLGGVL